MRKLVVSLSIGVLIILLLVTTINAQEATRSLPENAEGEFLVTINAKDYGVFGQVSETFCDGLEYVGSTLKTEQVRKTGNTVTFTLLGEGSFQYKLKAKSTGCCEIQGTLKDINRDLYSIKGDNEICYKPGSEPLYPSDSGSEAITTPSGSGSTNVETVEESPGKETVQETTDTETDTTSNTATTTPDTKTEAMGDKTSEVMEITTGTPTMTESPEGSTREEEKISNEEGGESAMPGFEILLAITGLIAVSYLLKKEN